MSFKMIYDARNRVNLDMLANATKAKAYQWYQYCINNKIQVLIYETIRTKEKQAENVKKGASKTMNSWHITGQALDWVLVNSKGEALWSSYNTGNGLKVINYAKSIGFTSGHDWGWDSPHLQYDKIAYGKDTFGKSANNINNDNDVIKSIQSTLNSRYNSKLTADGYYGEKTREALLIALKIEYNNYYSKEMGRKINTLDGNFPLALNNLMNKIVLSESTKTPNRIVYILQASLYVNGHKEIGKIDGLWGSNTTKTLNNYRKSKGFKQDGLLGSSTWKALLG